MTRRSAQPALVALALVPMMFVAACGDSTPPPAPEPVPETAPVVEQPAAPAKAVEPPPPVEVMPAPVVEEPARPVVPAPKPAPSRTAEIVNEHLGSVRDIAAGLGVELSDDDLAKVSEYVDGAVTEENVAKALQQFGADNPESAVGAIADKLGVNVPGMGGADADDAADAVKKGLPGALGGDVPDAAGAKGLTDADDPKKAVETLSIDEIKAERKAAVTALEAEQAKAIADIRATFAERSKRNPAKAAEHTAKLAEKEAAIEADYAAKIETTKAEYKARIQAAR